MSPFATTAFPKGKPFGKTASGEAVAVYTLENENGMSVEISNYGATIIRMMVPDREGNLGDVSLGFNTLAEYENDTSYFGALIGRFGNRVADGEFKLAGKSYILATNNEPAGVPCHLHGGERGFDRRVWKSEPVEMDGMQGVKLNYLSPDGEESYPGNLDVTVHYWLTPENVLRIEYFAFTDKATPVNLTNHSYFNLEGEAHGSVLDHELRIEADIFTPVNKGLIPTGEFTEVAATPFDFTEFHKIGERMDADNEQLQFGCGYDHNFVLRKRKRTFAKAAEVRAPESGRVLEVWTDQPGVQFYSGNFIGSTALGKSGEPYSRRGGFCLETQHYPDSPNQQNFPTTILNPGEIFKTVTEYRFKTRERIDSE